MGHVAETASGRVEGREKDGVLLFAGIPYAAAPTGDRRFRPPVPHPGWSGVRDGRSFGPVAPQSPGALEAMTGARASDWDEDCLFLNVQTPGLDDGRRPVLVWLHGGGFTNGAGSIPWYNGARFVTNGEVVVVTCNYRLGALGWLHLGEVDQTFSSSGVAGLLDQVAVLEWVRDNVAAFGGDPGNVTIFGESAGGMSVATLLGTPRARGLFRRAIAQSGAAHNVQGSHHAAEVADRLLHTLGLTTVAELQAVPAGELLKAQQAVAVELTIERANRPDGTGLGLPFSPVVDGEVVPRQPIDAVRAGEAAGVDLLVGTTRDEWNLFGLMARSVEDEETVVRRLGRLFEDPHEVAAVYRQRRDQASHDELWSAIMTDRVFRIPAIRLAEAHSAHQPNTFMYLFEWASTAFGGRLGSCHALEIPFVFDNLDQPGVTVFTGDDPPQAVADAMHRAWLAFARTGDPNHDGPPAWPRYDLETRATMHLDLECRVEHDPAPEERAAWDGVL